MYTEKTHQRRLLAKLAIAVVFVTAAYVFFSPHANAQSPSRFEGADIVITNENTTFHVWSGGPVKFEVVEGTIAEILYFADPEVVNGEVWRKTRVADGNYGYVQEDSFDAFTGTVPTIWREINYQPSQVHLNYERRKGNYDIVIDQGVEYVNPNSDGIISNDTDAPVDEEVDEEAEEEVNEDPQEEEVDEADSDFEGRDIVVMSRNATFHNSPGGSEKFEVARGTMAEILYFSTPQVADGEIWHKLRVADGNWGYVEEDSLDHYTGSIPAIWREINYQPSAVHLNYEARKGGNPPVTNQVVNYINPEDDDLEDNDDQAVEEEEVEDEADDEVEVPTYSNDTRELMLQLIALLKELIRLRMLDLQNL